MARENEIELLLVDDNEEFLNTMVRRFTKRGFHVHHAINGPDAIGLASRRELDVAVLDMMMPEMSGLQLFEKFKENHVECEVIFLTGQGTIESAVTAMKAGAYDYLSKPFPLKDLEPLIEKAHERRLLRKENQQLKNLLKRHQPKSTMIGQSARMQEVFRLIDRAGPSDKTILIQGESGTGKELVARDLHAKSSLADRPMVIINCAALPETLLESELFGHEKGAFTGATGTKPGLFEVADGGTLFIDEIGEMPGTLQAKLLRVLEDGSFRRVGSIKERRVKVRLLAATNRDLAEDVKTGRFREDLYYRINVMSLELPTLRDRPGDVPLLIAHFLGPEWEMDPECVSIMDSYSWPGNVRQLSNAIERAKIMAESDVITIDGLPREIREAPLEGREDEQDSDELSTLEKSKVLEILRRENGNKTRAARTLGIERRKLYRLIEKYGIDT